VLKNPSSVSSPFGKELVSCRDTGGIKGDWLGSKTLTISLYERERKDAESFFSNLLR